MFTVEYLVSMYEFLMYPSALLLLLLSELVYDALMCSYPF